MVIVLASAHLIGCASLDPTSDITQAQDMIVERTSVAPDFRADVAPVWDGVTPLTEDLAVRTALQNNRAIRAAVEEITAARADYVQAHLLPNPVLNLSVGIPTDGLGGEPLFTSAMQQLTALWRRPLEIDAATARLRARVLSVSDQAIQLVADVRTAHTDVALTQQALDIQMENLELVQRTRDLMQETFDVGEASGLDVNRLQLDVLAADTRRADLARDYEAQRRELLALLGMADHAATWSITASDVDLREPMDEATVIELTIGQRLDVLAARTTAESLGYRVELAELGTLPDVSAGVGYRQNFASRPGVFPAITLTPKVFDDNSARLVRSTAEARRAALSAEQVLQEALTEARTSWIRWRAEGDTARRYDQQIVDLARDNLALAQASLDAGDSDLTTYLEVQRQYNAARLEYIARQRSAVRAYFALQRAVGGTFERLPPPTINISREAKP